MTAPAVSSRRGPGDGSASSKNTSAVANSLASSSLGSASASASGTVVTSVPRSDTITPDSPRESASIASTP